MLQQLDDVNFGGPYGVYFSRGWTKYMSKDYSAAYPGATLRTKLNGMPLRTVAWAEEGGLELMFKVMGIMAPRVRVDHDNLTGICHGVAA